MDFLTQTNVSNLYLYRGEVYRGLRPVYTTAQALQEFMHALELDPKNYSALRAIAGIYLYDEKDYPLAEFYVDQAIGLKPDLAYAYITRGDLYRRLGDLPRALAAYQDALARLPDYQAAIDRIAAVQAELRKQAP
jgi:tetratricopeptide (TPR) repeat protein